MAVDTARKDRFIPVNVLPMVMINTAADGTGATTRIDCETTDGYNVKPGVHAYEYCPFCGHSTTEGDDHQVVISLPA